MKTKDGPRGAELRASARQQGAVARLGLRALAGGDLGALMDETVIVLADTLGAEYAYVLELQPGGEHFEMRACVGWQPGSVGAAELPAGHEMLSGYSLRQTSPVVVEDLSKETRFKGSPLHQKHGVVSDVSVAIHARDQSYGVLGAHSTRIGAFHGYDRNFVQALGNVLSTAIVRARDDSALRESEERFRAVMEAAPVSIIVVDDGGKVVLVNDRTEQNFGYPRDQLLGKPVEMLIPETIRPDIFGAKTQFWPGPGPVRWGLDLAGLRSDGSTFPVEVGISFASVPGGTQGIAFVTDISERKLSEQAVQNERSRLARDLHDAVTQSLFSASLIAEVLPTLWEKDAGEGRRRVGELRQLTRGALAEMRTLLLELRPDALSDAPLGNLIRHLADALTNRARIPVELILEGDGILPSDVKVAFYRSAQEALNNVGRHSQANAVTIAFTQTVSSARLVVEDDGVGFTAGSFDTSHMGLRIMRERSQAIGAQLTVDSEPGNGVRIALQWQAGAPAGGD